jgi:hypothetical protein
MESDATLMAKNNNRPPAAQSLGAQAGRCTSDQAYKKLASNSTAEMSAWIQNPAAV